MASDDNNILKQIRDTHSRNSHDHQIDLEQILHIVDDILTRATLHVNTTVPDVGLQPGLKLETLKDDKAEASAVRMSEESSSIIDRISGELAYKCVEGGDKNQTVISLFTMLSSYSWEAKVILTLAAFALNYGEFWLLAQIYLSNPLAKSMAILKRLPVIMEHSDTLRPRFDSLSTLIKAMLKLARCIATFKKLPSMYTSYEIRALSAAKEAIPEAVYWTVKGVVICTTRITNLKSEGHKSYGVYMSEAQEMLELGDKINDIHDNLKKQLDTCSLYIDEKRDIEAYESLVHIFDRPQTDNMKVLRPLICSKDDLQPLYDGSSKSRVNLDVLKGKNVLLLITGLDISVVELKMYKVTYDDSRRDIATRLDSHYEVVWVPIVDPSTQREDQQRKFEELQSSMCWYTVYHPSIIDNAVIRFVREKWHFKNKSIMVMLDPRGTVMSSNAIHMMWIWYSNAFPFTRSREEDLWKEETWRLEFLVINIDSMVLSWIKEGKYIFLYGGDDIDWIRKFTSVARTMALEAQIPLKMVYIGQSGGKKEQMRSVMAAITADKLSDTWDEDMICNFWIRLESMLFSKIQLGVTDDHDPIAKEIMKLLSYDKNSGWAMLSHGNEVFVNGLGTTVLSTMSDYKFWEEYIAVKGFDTSFKDHHDKLRTDSHLCRRFEFPNTDGRILDHIKCPECRHHMDKYRTFLCCHD